MSCEKRFWTNNFNNNKKMHMIDCWQKTYSDLNFERNYQEHLCSFIRRPLSWHLNSVTMTAQSRMSFNVLVLMKKMLMCFNKMQFEFETSSAVAFTLSPGLSQREIISHLWLAKLCGKVSLKARGPLKKKLHQAAWFYCVVKISDPWITPACEYNAELFYLSIYNNKKWHKHDTAQRI